MKDIKDLRLTEKEKQYLTKLQKNTKIIYVNYVTVGLSLCAAAVGLFMGVKLKEEKGFLMLIIFGGLGVVLLMATWIYQKHSRIIAKLKQYIEDHTECS